MENKSNPEENPRLTALLVYLAAFCQSINKPLGLTLLNKLLYYIDFGHYALHQKPITELSYLKNHYGPVPQALDTFVGQMVKNGVLTAQRHEYTVAGKSGITVGTAYTKDSPILLDVFDPTEMQTITKTVLALTEMTPTELSKRSHEDYPWSVAKLHDLMPLEGAKYCDFEWLDYYAHEHTPEELAQLAQLRTDLDESPEFGAVMSKITGFYRSRSKE